MNRVIYIADNLIICDFSYIFDFHFILHYAILSEDAGHADHLLVR